MPAPGLFPILTPGKFPDHAEDVVLAYRDRFRADAAGEAAWMLHCMEAPDMARMVKSVLARALRMAATELEKDA